MMTILVMMIGINSKLELKRSSSASLHCVKKYILMKQAQRSRPNGPRRRDTTADSFIVLHPSKVAFSALSLGSPDAQMLGPGS